MHSQGRPNLIFSSKKWQAIGPDLAVIPFDVPPALLSWLIPDWFNSRHRADITSNHGTQTEHLFHFLIDQIISNLGKMWRREYLNIRNPFFLSSGHACVYYISLCISDATEVVTKITKEWRAISIYNCPWSFPITSGSRTCPYPKLILP